MKYERADMVVVSPNHGYKRGAILLIEGKLFRVGNYDNDGFAAIRTTRFGIVLRGLRLVVGVAVIELLLWVAFKYGTIEWAHGRYWFDFK